MCMGDYKDIIYLNSVLAVLSDMHSMLVKIMLVLWVFWCAVAINTDFIICVITQNDKGSNSD